MSIHAFLGTIESLLVIGLKKYTNSGYFRDSRYEESAVFCFSIHEFYCYVVNDFFVFFCESVDYHLSNGGSVRRA